MSSNQTKLVFFLGGGRRSVPRQLTQEVDRPWLLHHQMLPRNLAGN